MEDLKNATDSDSISEVIRRAVALYDFMSTNKNKGYETILRDKDGNEKLVDFF